MKDPYFDKDTFTSMKKDSHIEEDNSTTALKMLVEDQAPATKVTRPEPAKNDDLSAPSVAGLTLQLQQLSMTRAQHYSRPALCQSDVNI